LAKQMLRVISVKHHNSENCFTVFTGVLLRKKIRSDDYIETKERRTFTGYFISIVPGDYFLSEVETVESTRYGSQCRINAYERVMPATEAEIRKYLKASVKGLGPIKVDALLEVFGLDIFSILAKNPERIYEVKLPPKIAQALVDFVQQNQAYEKILAFLSLHQIDVRLALPIYQHYGINAIQKISTDPYALYLEKLIDFHSADKLYFNLSGGPFTPHRIKNLVLYCLREDSESNGDVYTESNHIPMLADRASAKIYKELGICDKFPDAIFSDALVALEAEQRVILVRNADQNNVYLSPNYHNENGIVRTLDSLASSPKRFSFSYPDISAKLAELEQATQLKCAPKQRDAVFTALTSPAMILTGGPGTGKTQTVDTLIKMIKLLAPKAKTVLCAPTGRAAIRISEITGKKAATIHRTLNLGVPNMELGDEGLECDFLIVDESSMIDISLFYKLLRTTASFSRLIIIGDHEQLPSIGPGLVLRDLIQSECLPIVVLDQVFRQAGESKIVANAHAIRKQTVNVKTPLLLSTEAGGDFYFIERQSPSAIRNTIQQSVAKLQKDCGFKLPQIQILSPVKNNDLGTGKLNEIIQSQYSNDSCSYESGDTIFHLNDKVIHTKNNYDLDVFNGEIGTIEKIGYTIEKALQVSFPNKENPIWYSESDVAELDLAYAITTHKSQGSEFPVVIIPIHDSLLHNLDKALLYTAITRAKQMVIIIGNKECFFKALQQERAIKRNSCLVKKLQAKLAQESSRAG